MHKAHPPGGLAVRWGVRLLAFLLVGLIQPGYAQGLSGTITGIVQDQSKALIPGAAVALIDEGTGAARRTVTNAEGFFSINAIPAGTYDLVVDAPGFAKFEQKTIVLHGGDKLTFPNIAMALSGVAEQVKVEATPDAMVPVDTGEKAHVITAKEIANLSVLGRSADELLKILPGVVYTNPDDGGTPAGFVVQFNKGIGNYNVAGTRNTQIANRSDGTDVIDPGCNCGSAVTPNVDMVQEIKVQTSNFAAENAQGPVVFNSVSKSGTSEFHGEGYIYLRRSEFNSQDWRNNFFHSAKPQDSFYFPGFNIGGPLTKGRKKVFFFAGVEWMRQNHDLGVRPAVVPTQAMREGDFSDANYLSQLNGYDANTVPHNDAEGNNNWSSDPITSSMLSGGKISPSAFDPGGKAMINLMPLPNLDPAQSGGYNYSSHIINPEHRNQQLFRIDYNISDNTKLYTRFNHEYQASPYPFTLWWYNSNDVPFPGKLKGNYTTWSSSTSLVHVLSPTTTNELVVGLTDWRMPHTVQDPKAVSRDGLGYPYQGIFGASANEVPSFSDWGGGVADFVQPGGLIDPKIFGYKWLVNVSDNFSKVVGTHTMKFGAYFAVVTNDEPTTNYNNGFLEVTNWGNNSTGNAYADLLMGRIGEYTESTANIVGNYRKREWSGYAQDSWKVSRRLTLEYGARFQHSGWMYDKAGRLFGFDSRLYNPNAPLTDYTGLVANNVQGIANKDASGNEIGKSVWKTPRLKVAPRLGFAWDITGHGSTVLRGGGGIYYYNDRNGDSFGIFDPPLQTSVTICCGLLLKDIDNIDPTKHLAKPALTALLPNENVMPATYNWSLTLSKRIPSQTVIEASYVGNSSSHQTGCVNCGTNLNAVPEGAMFGHESEDPNNFRPFQQYGSIGMRGHNQSQNYNSLQVTANRQTGRINYQVAYAFAKALGVGGDSFGTSSDQFDTRRRSYGPLPYDRTHTLSIAYNIMLPGNFHHKLAAGLMNGWQISGISQLQSGAPLSGFSMSGTLADTYIDPNGNLSNVPWDAKYVAGTPDTTVRPVLLCDPRSGVADGQYANPACFAAPHVGQNGVYEMPYMKGPAFMNHDASLFKNFKWGERKNIQLRWSMYNFLNHPNAFFLGNDPGRVLNFVAGVPDQSSLDHFGKTSFKQGRRLMQVALKFQF